MLNFQLSYYKEIHAVFPKKEPWPTLVNEASYVICQELALLGVTYYNIAIDIQDARDTKYISRSENTPLKSY